MEPEGRPLTPGTSYGPPAFLSCTSQSSCSPGARCSWGSEPTEAAGPERRFRSSAFPSSLSWDSDSERDALDEEELQHFSNPHGLAAHSPGSPSSGLRFDSEDEHEPEQLHLQSPTNPCSPVVRRSRESTKAEEPNRARPGPTHLSDSEVWSVSEGAELFLSNVKPKDVCQMEEEAENREGEKSLKGKESKEPERDVYTFPGDSDPESPPPAPWAHCTFIQRCKKKRVLLRPFSGLGHIKRSVPEAGKRARGGPQKSKTAEAARSSRRGGVHDFEEAMEKPIKFIDRGGKKDKAESVQEPGKEIFTCVECSIYFKKQVHLQEHMVEHCRSASGGSRRPGKGGRFRCVECGWNLPSRLALTDHHKQHQESRLKILEEIEKLNENEKPDEAQNPLMSPEPAVTQDTGSAPGKVSGAEMVTSPDPAPTPEADPAVVESDTSPPNSGRPSAPARNVSAYRRRFICNKCNFSARTPQALANHSKTHNRKKAAPRPPLACGRCAFLTSSPTVLREHQKVHPGEVTNSGEPADEPEPRSASNVGARTSKPALASDEFSDCGLLPDAAQGQRQGSTARPGGRRVFNRRFSRGGKTFARDFEPRLDSHRLPGGEEHEKDEGQDTELCQQMAHSPGALEPCIRASRDDGSAAASLPPKKNAQDEGEREPGEDAKVFFLRRSTRVVAAAAADGGSEDDDSGDERVQRFLSEGIWDEDDDEIDAGAEALRSVERKCPYCPDRFHNGIGLANHVRGHLNRVGVSYNVRHFISPEEVNAIEKKFSYQKKKKKVANFDPDTFSVMHCEFCGAGFDTRAGLSSHARAHLRDFGITNWDVTISPIHILRELFSSRPDLVIPTAPPRSLASPQQEDDEEPEDEGEGVIEVKLEGETTERTVSASVCAALTSASPQRWKEERGGDEEEAAEEDDDEELQLPGPGKTGLSRADSGSLSPEEDADAKGHNLKCEVCGAQFETRRGLSSHARSHLRQLGIGVSESSGAPIDLLYQIAKERDVDGQSDSPPPEARPAKGSSPQKDEDLDDMDLDEKPIPFSILAEAVPPSSSTPPASPAASPEPPRLASPSPVVRKAPISSLLPVSSPLRSPEHKAGGPKGSTSGLSVPAAATAAKPLWAPQESDAPLNLALDVDPNKDIVCQLCGAWFETRKGLSSHARAHLRHFGVEYSESKGSPIDLLNQLIETDDFKHKASALQPDGHAEARGLGSSVSASKQTLLSVSSSSLHFKVSADGGRSTSKATSASGSSLLAPPTKRLKSSSMQVFRLSSGELMALPHSEPPKEIGCEFCGEYFENRKGLSSHARSHLRQMGITEWSVNGSPIDTLRDIITRRGLPCALPLKPLKTPPPSSPGPPRSPLSTSSSPPATLLSRHPFAFARPSSPPQLTGSKSSPTLPASSGGLVLKLKPEPVQLDVSTQGAVGRTQSFPSEALNWRNDGVFPLNLAMAHEVEPTRDIRCEFCGEYFENRKGLSSHARSHLRQMGITEWSVNGSPIDTLREVMHKRGLGASSHSDRGVKKESSQWDNAAAAGTSEGLAVSGYQPSKFRKSPLSLLQSGSRLHKQGLPAGPTAAPSGGRFFRVSPLGKRPQSEGGQSGETPHSSPHSPKNFSPLPHDFSFKRKPSPDKHGHQDPSCELCGFYFENRKALASHARAHLRQFGVTEWCVNGSPIETLSAWMRSRPQKVLEMHRSYMQGNRSTLKKKASSSSSSSQWSSSLAVSLVRPLSREAGQGSSKAAESEAGANRPAAAVRPGLPRLAGGLPLQAQVARSELNVRLPRGFERRPLKHPSCPEGAERDPPKPPRTGTVPALVPKPPTYPLVKLVGKFYTLKCRFCEVEFHGPLSVQEDWIRHLQQHILKMNYNKPAAPKAASAEPPAPAQPAAPTSPSPTPPAERAPMVTATDIVKASEEQPALCPTPLPLPTQSV